VQVSVSSRTYVAYLSLQIDSEHKTSLIKWGPFSATKVLQALFPTLTPPPIVELSPSSEKLLVHNLPNVNVRFIFVTKARVTMARDIALDGGGDSFLTNLEVVGEMELKRDFEIRFAELN
jgi:hypothetical protein